MWHHVAISYDVGNTFKMYFDGVLVNSAIVTVSPSNIGNLCWGGGFIWDTSQVDKYIAAARVYQRVLTDEEIAGLANEFTPTQS